MRYAFENFTLDVAKHELRRDGELIAVEPQVFALLIHLIEQRERVVSKEELIEAIWEGRFVSDSVVSSRIKSARKALGDDGRTQRFIKTHHGAGFRFIASVEAATTNNVEIDQSTITEEIAPAPESALESSSPPAPPPELHRRATANNAASSERQSRAILLRLAAAAIIAVTTLSLWFFKNPQKNDQAVADTNRSSVEISQSPEKNTAFSAQATSVVVLPFDDFSQTGDQEYFADGISEELLNVLAQIDGLRVTSRTSAFAFKGRDASISDIASALGVSHVLEGSVRKAGSTLRITAQLIDARNDQHLWSQTYDRALTAENIFAVQDEISEAIVAELKGRIATPVASKVFQTESTDAYDAYLRGKALVAKRTEETVTEGIAELKRAATLDPEFAPAQSALVEAYVLASTYAGLSLEEAGVLAAPHMERALALAPAAPDSLAAKGRALSIFERNDAEAITYYKRAIAANPNSADAHRFLGLSQSNLLLLDAAQASFENAKRLDPLSPVIYANLSRVFWDKENVDAMTAVAKENLRLNPGSLFGRRMLGDALRESGDLAEAHRQFKDNEALYDASQDQLANLYYQIGRFDLATPYAGKFVKARIALHKLDKQQAVALTPDGSDLNDIAILRWAGDIDAAYDAVKQDIARRNLLSDAAQIAARDQTFDVYYAAILTEKNDPAAQGFRQKLSARFDEHSPSDFRIRDSFYAGAMWQVLKGDSAAALQWLDALIDAGFTAPEITIEPLFDSIRDTQGFQERLQRLEANAARHRTEIENQLSDPAADWVVP